MFKTQQLFLKMSRLINVLDILIKKVKTTSIRTGASDTRFLDTFLDWYMLLSEIFRLAILDPEISNQDSVISVMNGLFFDTFFSHMILGYNKALSYSQLEFRLQLF